MGIGVRFMAYAMAFEQTYADWLAMPDDGPSYELIDGELFINPPPSVRHQRIARHLVLPFQRHLDATAAGEVLSLGEDGYSSVGVHGHGETLCSPLLPDLAIVVDDVIPTVG